MKQPDELPMLGPALDEDIKVLQAIIQATDPKLVIEFGFFHGKSAKGMLDAMSPDARIISYDCTKDGKIDDPRFTFMKKSQEDFEPVPNVDFVFLDASHDLDLNRLTWIALEPCLTPNAIVAVHDTGTWPSNLWNRPEGYDLGGRYIPRPDERRFVNWLKVHYPDYQQIHLHSNTQVRHGITLLQHYNHLDV